MPSNNLLVEEHLGFAQVIALEYANIPGIQTDEAISEAQQALFRASQSFDASKGEFSAYAARSIRNALNTLYAKQLKLVKMFPVSLDSPLIKEPSKTTGSSSSSIISRINDSKQDVRKEVRRKESNSVLSEVMNALSPRERIVVEEIRKGKSLSEIGEMMGISKQAVHKVSTSAFGKLRTKLSQLGYHGLDSQGFLKSKSQFNFKAG